MYLQVIRAWGNSKDFEYVLIHYYSVVGCLLQFHFKTICPTIILILILIFSHEAKLLLHISNYYIILKAVYTLCSLFGYLRCIITSVPSATVNRSWPQIVNTEIKAIHLPVRCHFWKADGDKTEAETMSWVLSAFSLSVASKPLFGLFWQVSFSLHRLSPQASGFSLEVSPARCGDPGFFAAACVARH